MRFTRVGRRFCRMIRGFDFLGLGVCFFNIFLLGAEGSCLLLGRVCQFLEHLVFLSSTVYLCSRVNKRCIIAPYYTHGNERSIAISCLSRSHVSPLLLLLLPKPQPTPRRLPPIHHPAAHRLPSLNNTTNKGIPRPADGIAVSPGDIPALTILALSLKPVDSLPGE